MREGNSLVSGGYTVRFTASQGTLQTIGGAIPGGQLLEVPVQAGFARVLLQSTTFETTSVVTAVVVNERTASDQLEVSFGQQAGPRKTYDNIIRVKGDYLWYSPESSYQIMEVIGNGSVTYQGIEVHANLIQIDLQDYLVLAKDLLAGVTVATSPPPYDAKAIETGQKPPYKGDYLSLDLRSFSGSVFSSQLGQTITFSGRDLKRQPDQPAQPGAYDLFDLSGAKVRITARSALVYPFEKIRFDRAKFLVNGVKVFSLPYYFETLGYNAQLGPAISQWINYSTQDGLIVDFPYYFDVGDRQTNEFRLTRGVRTGLFGRTNGFQLSYAHHTDLKADKGSFDFVIDDLLGSFGVQYNRQQRFGPLTYGTLSLAWPRHRNFYGSSSLYTPAGPGNLSVSLNADYIRGLSGGGNGVSANGNAVWQSDPVRMSAVDSSFTASLGAGYSRDLTGQDFYTQSVALSLTKNPWRFGREAMLQPYAGFRFQNTVNGNQEVGFTFNTTFRQQLGPAMSYSLAYTYDTTWSRLYKVPDRHVLSANWSLNKEGLWRGYAYGTYNLQDRSASASALLDYQLTHHWGVAGQGLYQSSTAGSYSESEVWVYRVLGARELRLRYSIEQGRLFFEMDNSF